MRLNLKNFAVLKRVMGHSHTAWMTIGINSHEKILLGPRKLYLLKINPGVNLIVNRHVILLDFIA